MVATAAHSLCAKQEPGKTSAATSSATTLLLIECNSYIGEMAIILLKEPQAFVSFKNYQYHRTGSIMWKGSASIGPVL